MSTENTPSTAQVPPAAAPDTQQPDPKAVPPAVVPPVVPLVATPAPAAAAPVVVPAAQPPVETPVVPDVKKEGAAAEPAPATKDKPADQPAVLKNEDLKLPAGSLLDPKIVEEIVSFANAKKLSKEDAQGLLEREHKIVSSYVEGEVAKATQMQDQWFEASKKDKEFGGEAYEANVELGNRVLKRFGTPELEKLLQDSGGHLHPEVQRLFFRLGKAMAPDQLVISSAGSEGNVKGGRLADRIYAASSDKKKDEPAE